MLNAVIIVAGGIGKRMNAPLPKQFLEIGNKPILMHTINRFSDFNSKTQIILVLPDDYFSLWQDLCDKYNFKTNITIASGGKERFHSVKNGLNMLKENNGIVAIHDGVRPFIDNEFIKRGIEAATEYKAAIPAILPSNTVRFAENNENSKHIDRSKVRLIQTPQFFDIQTLLRAYDVEYSTIFTDDASVIEHYGQKVFLFNGDEKNIKITTKFDLEFAKYIISLQSL